MQIVNKVLGQWAKPDFGHSFSDRLAAFVRPLCFAKEIRAAAGEFLALSAAALVVPAFLALDLLVFKNGVSELSLTELSQEALILATAVILGIKARRRPASRGLLTLMSGFFVCVFIRELDCVFDALFYRGFWVWLVVVTFVIAVGYMISSKSPVIQPLYRFLGQRSQLFVTLGLVVVLVLSRTLCSGNLIWRHVFAHDVAALLKNSMQEGLELFGYQLIFWGACLFSGDTAR